MGDDITSFIKAGEDKILTTGSTYTLTVDGIVAAMTKYMLSHDDYTIDEAQNWAVNKIGDAHEDFSWLLIEGASCSTDGPWHVVTFNYKGIPSNADRREIKISASVSQEPIETHPEFSTTIAGTPVRPPAVGLNNSVWNDDATFKGFVIDPDCPRPVNQNKQGVKSYLSPTMTYESSRSLGSQAGVDTSGGVIGLLDDVGQIYKGSDLPMIDIKGATHKYNPPKGVAYDKSGERDGDRDWLLVGLDIQELGDGQMVNYKWRMSGRFKWNEEIYEKKEGGSAGGASPVVSEANIDDEETLTHHGWPDELGEIQKDLSVATDGAVVLTMGTSMNCQKNSLSATDRFICKVGKGVNFVIGKIGEVHSEFSNCLFTGGTVVEQSGEHETVEIKYQGLVNDEELVYSASSSSGSDPIDSHLDFCDFAGDSKAPNFSLSNPKFNSDGTFAKFHTYMTDNVTLNDFAGVSSYLVPSVMWTEKTEYTNPQNGLDDLELIGTISEPESSKAPKLKDDRNWLVTSVQWEQLGLGCRVTVQYRMSGKNGWDEDIYSGDTDIQA